MLDAIASLGRLKYSDDPEKLMAGLIRNQSTRENETKYYVELNFSTSDQPFQLQIKEYSSRIPKVLNYVGIVPAAGMQYHTTGHDLRHLCSQVLPALLEKLPEKSQLSGKVSRVLSNAFVLDRQADPKSRYRYLLNIEQLSTIDSGYVNELFAKRIDKDRPKVAASAILEYIESIHQISSENIKLFTILIDGEHISSYPDYIQTVIKEQEIMYTKARKGMCYLTGQKTKVSAELTKFKFKYYITDKLNFSSQLSGKYEKNFQISREGTWQLLLGERFIMNHLRLRIGSFNVYMIPEFINELLYEAGRIESAIVNISEKIRKKGRIQLTQAVEKNLTYEQDIIQDEMELEDQLLLSFLFYEENKSEMKVYRHIKDISPSRIKLMNERGEEVNHYFKNIAPNFHFYNIAFESLYYLIPLEIDNKGKVKNPQQLMQIYDSIFSKRLLDKQYLISQFVVLLARVKFNSFGGLQVSKKWRINKDADIEAKTERLWVRLIWEQQQFIMWLEEISNLNKDGDREVTLMLIERLQDEQEHINKSGFTKAEAALFLLGCSIKLVADAQRINLKSKPILRKLNFRGMTIENLKRLVLDVFEKSEQYKNTMMENRFYTKFENYFHESKQLLDQGISEWQLSDSDTIFYILSGYSYITAKRTGTSSRKENKIEADLDSELLEGDMGDE